MTPSNPPIDVLLYYLSSLAGGGRRQFSESVLAILGKTDGEGEDEVKSPYFVREILSSLCHVEFDSSSGDWCVVPPILVELEPSGSAVGLAGSRSPGLVASCLSAGFESVERDGITQWKLIVTPERTIAQVSESLKLAVSSGFSKRLSRLLPSAEQAVAAAKIALPPHGWSASRFDENSLRWLPTENLERPGVYRFMHFTVQYRVRLSDQWLLVDRAAGLYEWLRQRGKKALSYDPNSETLTVPAILGLPSLAARTAVMCTGLPPKMTWEGSRRILVFENVPEEIAMNILTSIS